MASRLSGSVVRRPSLPLTAADEADLAALRQSPEMLRILSKRCQREIPSDHTEGSVLQALLEAALRAIKEEAQEESMDLGYQDLADDSQFWVEERRFRDRRASAFAHYE